jgi:hypothetical protein
VLDRHPHVPSNAPAGSEKRLLSIVSNERFVTPASAAARCARSSEARDARLEDLPEDER